mgnify:CR=1 FL=1
MHTTPNTLALIGNTPLVKINKLFPDSKATILAKLEFYNPASSVKDRLGIAIARTAATARYSRRNTGMKRSTSSTARKQRG